MALACNPQSEKANVLSDWHQKALMAKPGLRHEEAFMSLCDSGLHCSEEMLPKASDSPVGPGEGWKRRRPGVLAVWLRREELTHGKVKGE